MDIMAWLRKEGVKFEHLRHAEVFTAQEVAQKQHVPGREMIKAVLVKTDQGFALAVLPSIQRINFAKLAKALGAKSATLASEADMAQVFPNVEIGAEPPFGNLYNVPTVVEERLAKEPEVVFQAGTHTDTVKMAYADYARLAKPVVGQFGDPI
jgi:Ala-tRNA(Pro) deacylase